MKIFNLELTREQTRLIVIIIGVILVFGLVVVGFIYSRRTTGPSGILEFWGLYDDSATWQPFISAFNKEHRGVTIRYTQMNPETYERDLLDALAAGRGPDIMMFHSSWLPKHGNKISPLPESMMTMRQFQETFPDVAFTNFVSQNRIFALPLWTDALAMYYNKDLFNIAGIATPPANWDEFVQNVVKLSTKDRFGNLTKVAAALGTSSNVNNASDLLSLIMLQVGARMISDDGDRAAFDQTIAVETAKFNPGATALRFYTDFSNPKLPVYTWNASQPNSLEAFIQGKVAVVFDYNSAQSQIKRRSPNLRLGIAPVPQPKNAEKVVNYSNFWAYSVPTASQNSEVAWQFLVYMTQKDIERAYVDYVERVASRRDILQIQQNSPNLGVFADAILSAANWYQVDSKEIDKIFRDMIDEVVLGGVKPDDAIGNAADKVSLLMSR